MSNMIENGNYCVYIHTSPSGKRYVGMTGQKPEKRWGKNGSHYLKKEKNGDYMHIAFARAILKYGWDNIEHEVVASNLTREEACNFEKLLIEKLNTKNRNYGYNLKDGGTGGGFSEETLKKMSESHKGIKQSEETIKKRAEKLRGSNNPNYGKPMSEEQRKKISDSRSGENSYMYGKHFNEEIKQKMRESQKTQMIVQYDLQWNVIKVWNSISNAGRELGISVANISACCRNKRRSAGGFIWKYYDENQFAWNNDRQVFQYSLSGELINKFKSLTEAASKTNVSYNGILACCKGIHYSSGGFVWKYCEDVIETIV